MSDDENQRAVLRRRLENPEFNARMQRMYEQLVREPADMASLSSDAGTQIAFRLALPRMEPGAFSAPSVSDMIEIPAEPTTIEELWAGNWQRSVGAYTLTRLDETVRLESGDGARVIYSPIKWKGEFTWKTEHFDESGRKIETRRYEQTFESAKQAVFEMHRSAHSELDEHVF